MEIGRDSWRQVQFVEFVESVEFIELLEFMETGHRWRRDGDWGRLVEIDREQ